MAATRTRRKRRVGQVLVELRQATGCTAEDAAQLLERQPSWLYKVETGLLLCAHAELIALMTFYGASDEKRDEVVTLWKDARQDGTRIQGATAMPPKFRTFLRAEADADYAYRLEMCAIPGLCQTAEYWHAVRHAARHVVSVSDEMIGKAESALRARQALLEGQSPLVLHAVIDEGVIRRITGGRTVMVAQLRRLVDLAGQPNITVQIVPEDAGAYGTMSGPVNILGYDDPQDPESVYAERAGGGEWIDDKEDVAQIHAMFDSVATDQALTAAQSVELIEARIQQIEGPNE